MNPGHLVSLMFLAAAEPAGAATAQAGAPPAVQLELERCSKVTDPALRLACLDAAVGSLLTATRSGTLTLVDRGQMREARRSLFGFSLPKLPFFSGDRSAEEQSNELTTTIRSSRAVGGGRYRITLGDSGAVWETTESYTNFDPPAAGQSIVIRRGALGSYMLRVNGQRGVKGRRVG